MKTILTIAGSDCSGGAGIQADIKTITVHKMYAMSVITALTAQNTTGVYGVQDTAPEFVASQLDCVFEDIRPDAVKIGMVSNEKIIRVIAEKLRDYQAGNVVVDPVMAATSGSVLMQDGAGKALVKELFPLASIITPNIPEAEILTGHSIKSHKDMEQAAESICRESRAAVLLKGGHLWETADDFLCTPERHIWYRGDKIDNPNTHGTGCTLSSAIACGLAAGKGLEESVREAKAYISRIISAGLNLGKGKGPLNHIL